MRMITIHATEKVNIPEVFKSHPKLEAIQLHVPEDEGADTWLVFYRDQFKN